MSNKTLFTLWGAIFIICAALGFIPEPAGAGQLLMTIAALVFFLPPAVLLYRAKVHREDTLRKLIRNLSALSLGATLILLVANFLTALQAEWLGVALHYILAVVSTPMICSGRWVLSLFLWACLLVLSFKPVAKAAENPGKSRL